MALNLKGGMKKPAATPAQQPSASAPQKATNAPQASQSSAPSPTPKGGGLSFLKRGNAAKEQMAKEDLKSEMKSKGKTLRFWVPKDKDVAITFLDGDLKEGILDVPFFYEHNITMNGKYGNFFICTQDEEPCPICEGGAQAAYVGALTIIDHSSYISKKDGKEHKDERKLFVAKKETIKLLQKAAEKRGGSLRGCTFDVSRTGEMSASVGNVFDFTEKLNDQQLSAKYGENSKPFNYEEILAKQYLPAKELRKLGFGSTNPVGSESPMGEGENYDNEM